MENLKAEISVSHDKEAGAYYIRFVETKEKHFTREVKGHPDIYLDFNREGMLLGVEILSERAMPRLKAPQPTPRFKAI